MSEIIEKNQTNQKYDIQLPKDILPKFSKQDDLYVELEPFPEEETDTSVFKDEDMIHKIKKLLQEIRVESKSNHTSNYNFREKVQEK